MHTHTHTHAHKSLLTSSKEFHEIKRKRFSTEIEVVFIHESLKGPYSTTMLKIVHFNGSNEIATARKDTRHKKMDLLTCSASSIMNKWVIFHLVSFYCWQMLLLYLHAMNALISHRFFSLFPSFLGVSFFSFLFLSLYLITPNDFDQNIRIAICRSVVFSFFNAFNCFFSYMTSSKWMDGDTVFHTLINNVRRIF